MTKPLTIFITPIHGLDAAHKKNWGHDFVKSAPPLSLGARLIRPSFVLFVRHLVWGELQTETTDGSARDFCRDRRGHSDAALHTPTFYISYVFLYPYILPHSPRARPRPARWCALLRGLAGAALRVGRSSADAAGCAFEPRLRRGSIQSIDWLDKCHFVRSTNNSSDSLRSLRLTAATFAGQPKNGATRLRSLRPPSDITTLGRWGKMYGFLHRKRCSELNSLAELNSLN